MTRNLVSLATFAVLSGMVAAPGCRRQDQHQTVNVVGSTSIQPFTELLKEEYEKKNTGRKIEVQPGGSTAGVQAAKSGLAQIGMCSRSLSPDEAKELKEIVIARDGLAIVVHPGNPVTALTVEQLQKVFSGEITNWKDLGGSDGIIRVVTREEGSGTRESFVHLVMGKTAIAKSSLVQESNGAVKEVIKGDKAAIGYMSLGMVHHELKILNIDNEEATAANVLSGKYKLARPFLYVTKGEPNAEARAFIDFVLSDEGQKLLESEGLIRAK